MMGKIETKLGQMLGNTLPGRLSGSIYQFNLPPAAKALFMYGNPNKIQSYYIMSDCPLLQVVGRRYVGRQ
jgi:hypothetical protein